jgi:hypothetical protein
MLNFEIEIGNDRNDQVLLFIYDDKTYSLKSQIENLCLTIGILSLLTFFVGLLTPSGKFSFVQALIIPQIICFSLLQFDIVPLAYLGFNNLFLSNGFNKLSLEKLNIVPRSIYPFFGLSETSYI